MGEWNDHRSDQPFIALERCGPILLQCQKEEAWCGGGAGSSKGVLLLSCSTMFWASVVVHPFLSSASGWFDSETAYVNIYPYSHTKLAEGLGQGLGFDCK